MLNLGKKQWLLIVILFSVCLVVYTFSNLIISPWNCIIDLGSDSMKNIFTYVHHSTYGKGFWFDGMNYPYGEHIVFTDGIPLFSGFFATFHNVSPEAALSVMWWTISLSYILAIIYIYLILSNFSVKPLFAMLFAGLIGIFSPQLLRILGHYALSYSCIIPMIFYWTIKYHSNFKLKYPVYIFIIGIIFCFLHPYFSAMVLLWSIFYSIGYFIFIKQSFKNKLKHIVPMVFSSIGVLFFFGIFLKITDPIKDRPIMPFGTLVFKTSYWHVISSNMTTLWLLIMDNKIIVPKVKGGEGYAYVGFTSLIIFAFTFIIGIYKVLIKKKSELNISETSFSPIWLFIAFSFLLFAMGFPFIFHLQWLLNYISIMRQFRSLGRFSWIFYYIFTIYSVVVLNFWFIKLQSRYYKSIGYFIIFISLSLWIYEASDYIKFSRTLAARGKSGYDIVFSVNQKTWGNWLIEHNYQKNNFQALILLKMINFGTEKYWLDNNTDGLWLLTLGEIASLQLQLPMVDAALGRSSWKLARKQLKLCAGPFLEKPMLRDLKSDKPFLLLKYEHDTLQKDENYLLEAADYIGDFSSCKVYAYYPKRQFENDKRWADSINKVLPNMSSTDTVLGDNNDVYINHLENEINNTHFFGKGAISSSKKHDTLIAVMKIKPSSENQLFEYSNWFLLDKSNYYSPAVELAFFDSVNNKIKNIELLTKQSVDNNGLWSRPAGYFYMPKNCRKLISYIKLDNNITYIVLDEVMIRPANSIIISKSVDGQVLVNNHIFNSK